MTSLDIGEAQQSRGLAFRNAALAVLIVFSVFAFLGFSMYVDLEQAQAQFAVTVVGDIYDAIKEVIVAVAKAIVLMVAVRYAMDLVQKLEQNHTIRNILFYSDALGADQYLGDFLNKLTKKETVPVYDDSGEQILDAPPTQDLAGLIGEIGETAPGLEDLSEAEAEKLGFFEQPLDPVVRASITRVGIALLTSEAQCGGSNRKLVRNIAIYNASRALGFNPRTISPGSGVGFYQQLASYGNPFANRDFQELNLRDVAAGAEAEARRAAELELLSSGTKALRQQNFAITRTSNTIVGFINSQAATHLDAITSSSDNAFVNSIIGTIVDIAQAVIFTPGGVTLNERSYCDNTAKASTRGYTGIDVPKVEPAFITANGVTALEIDAGEEVTLNWSIGSHALNPGTGETTEISGIDESLNPVEPTGTMTVKPEEDTIYTLSVIIGANFFPGSGDGDGGSGGEGPTRGVQGVNTDGSPDESKRVPVASATVSIRDEGEGNGGGSGGGGGGGGGGSGTGNDVANPPNLKINQVVWIDEDVSNWAQTASLDAGVSGRTIKLNYKHKDKAGTWPAVDGSVGNAWLCAHRKSQWYCGTWEWLKPGQTEKSTDNLEEPGVIGKLDSEKELIDFVAQSGDHYYLMVSGLARNNQSNVEERSNLVRIVWP